MHDLNYKQKDSLEVMNNSPRKQKQFPRSDKNYQKFSGLDLQATTANEAGLFLHLKRCLHGKLGAWLVDHAIAAADLTGENEAFRLLA